MKKATYDSVLTINGGSSSIKFALYQTDESLEQGFHGSVDRIGLSGTNLTFNNSTGSQKGILILESSLDTVIAEIKGIQTEARSKGFKKRRQWPMIILRTLKSCNAEELFDKSGRLIGELAELPPKGERRMGANPHANGGLLLKELKMPDFRDYAVKVTNPGVIEGESTRVQGQFIRDVLKLNADSRNFRFFSPDETASNRWGDVFEVTNRCSTAEIISIDDHIAPDGRAMEMLSEHPHGLSDKDFEVLFTKDRPIIFAFHGYPKLIHLLTYRRFNHSQMHVRGYKEEGTTTTPFDMVVMNDLDRFHLAGDVIDRVPHLSSRAAYAKQFIRDRLLDHKNYIRKHGEDMPEIRNWKWIDKNNNITASGLLETELRKDGTNERK